MNLCEWVEFADKPGHWYCQHCGIPRGGPKGQRRPSPYPENLRRECVASSNGQPIKPPTLAQRYQNWRDATEAWEAAGKPERSSEEQHRIADICRGCEHYDKNPLLPIVMGGGQCKACGCGLQPERSLFNALRFATYRCKLGFWNKLIAEKLISFVKPPKKEYRDTADADGSAAG